MWLTPKDIWDSEMEAHEMGLGSNSHSANLGLSLPRAAPKKRHRKGAGGETGPACSKKLLYTPAPCAQPPQSEESQSEDTESLESEPDLGELAPTPTNVAASVAATARKIKAGKMMKKAEYAHELLHVPDFYRRKAALLWDESMS